MFKLMSSMQSHGFAILLSIKLITVIIIYNKLSTAHKTSYVYRLILYVNFKYPCTKMCCHLMHLYQATFNNYLYVVPVQARILQNDTLN